MSILILLALGSGVCIAGRLNGKLPPLLPPGGCTNPAARKEASKALPSRAGAGAGTACTGGGVLMTGSWNGSVDCIGGGVGCWRLVVDLRSSAKFVDLSN